MAEYDLYKLAALDETLSHFFFPALALHQRRYGGDDNASDDNDGYTVDEDIEPIRIPDTILYSYSKPTQWFYFDESSRRIMRRSSKMLNTMSILEYFTETSKSKIGVRAWFVYPQEPELIQPQTSDFLVDVVSQDAVGRTGVLRFLQSPKGKGILQHYIDNKTEGDGSMHNVYIRCDYSASHFSTDLLVSTKTLTVPAGAEMNGKKKSSGGGDAAHGGGAATHHGVGGRSGGVSLALRFSPYATTYERRPLVSSVMTTRLRNVCQTIAHRLKRLLSYTVASMHLVCRMDSEDKLYVLWCGSMRLHTRRYSHLSFRLSPQGTVHEPYNMNERGGGNIAATGKNNRKEKKEIAEDSVPLEDSMNPSNTGKWLSILSNIAQKDNDRGAGGRHHRTPQQSMPPQGAAAVEGGGSGSVGHEAATPRVDPKSKLAPDLDDTHVETISCCICRTRHSRSALVKINLQWVLYCMSLMDRRAQQTLGWNALADVPPSVALVCPNLSKQQFDYLVSTDPERAWLRTLVGVCVACITDCNKANDMMCEKQYAAPLWLGVDANYRPLATMIAQRKEELREKRRAKERALNDEELRSAKSLADPGNNLLTFLDTSAGDEDDERCRPNGSMAGTTRSAGARSIAASTTYNHNSCGHNTNGPLTAMPITLRSEVDQWLSHAAISFVASTKDAQGAADLFKAENGVYRRCGFGRPVIDARYVPPTPHLLSVGITDVDENRVTLAASLALLVGQTLEEREQGFRDRLLKRAYAVQADANGLQPPDVPCHTPL